MQLTPVAIVCIDERVSFVCNTYCIFPQQMNYEQLIVHFVPVRNL